MGRQFFYQKQIKRCHWSSLTQKPLFNAVLCVFVGLLLWSVPFLIFAINIFSDDFEEYTIGNLGGQGHWEVGGCYYKVSNELSYEGEKSASSTTSYSYCRNFPAPQTGFTTTGTISQWIYIDSSQINTGYWYSGMRSWDSQNGLSPMFGQVGIFNNEDILTLRIMNVVAPFDWYDVGIVQPNKWNFISINYNFSTHLYNVRLNTEERSADYVLRDFYPWNVASILQLDSFNMTCYIDDISDVEMGVGVCELESCKFCETYETCTEAGCSWYWSQWLQQNYCVEPVEQDPEECGAFWKCQYCDEEGCAEQTGFCEWKDIGFGDKCYMTEPEIPPEQQEWEAPELEDCGGLSGVELWLCNIKNFIAGIFMPSQSKINEFYLTMGTFKERFPFNYSRALSTFFSDIKTSFSTENNVPVKVLGKSGNVSFKFWSASSTIGGVPETFANILKDLSTFIIILLFVVWLISLIRRFL